MASKPDTRCKHYTIRAPFGRVVKLSVQTYPFSIQAFWFKDFHEFDYCIAGTVRDRATSAWGDNDHFRVYRQASDKCFWCYFCKKEQDMCLEHISWNIHRYTLYPTVVCEIQTARRCAECGQIRIVNYDAPTRDN